MKGFEESYIRRVWCWIFGHKWYRPSGTVTFCTRCDKVRVK